MSNDDTRTVELIEQHIEALTNLLNDRAARIQSMVELPEQVRRDMITEVHEIIVRLWTRDE